jgi:hypothetical protein
MSEPVDEPEIHLTPHDPAAWPTMTADVERLRRAFPALRVIVTWPDLTLAASRVHVYRAPAGQSAAEFAEACWRVLRPDAR